MARRISSGSVLLFHGNAPHTDAGARRNDRDRLIRKRPNDFGHPIARITGVVLDPLVQDSGEARSHSSDRSTLPETANHGQP
jgi:hypothetical protein